MLDLQGSSITRPYAIQNVGVTGLQYPLTVGLHGQTFRTGALWSLGVSLPASQRGAHMSRFVECIDGLGERPVDLPGMVDFCRHVSGRLEAERTRCGVEFTWFRRVKAPVSGMESYNPHLIRWSVDWFDSQAGGNSKPSVDLQVQVAVKALCPCSKAISDRGAHNQRSTVTVSLTAPASAAATIPSVERIVAMVESHASAPVYPLLKRADEKFVTERAYDNPVFVEDLVRAVAGSLSDMPGVESFRVHVQNHESIHAHDCFAEITSP
ncbi:MAG: hypothetical protein RIQ81_2033 [Pseudomonadota bacterium]|jgi:GTP cyclohydrolase I